MPRLAQQRAYKSALYSKRMAFKSALAPADTTLVVRDLHEQPARFYSEVLDVLDRRHI